MNVILGSAPTSVTTYSKNSVIYSSELNGNICSGRVRFCLDVVHGTFCSKNTYHLMIIAPNVTISKLTAIVIQIIMATDRPEIIVLLMADYKSNICLLLK